MEDNNSAVLMGKIKELFKQSMGEEVEVNLETKKDDIGEWDSINHLNLIVELESSFDLGLSMDEIEKIDSVRQIVDLINNRKN